MKGNNTIQFILILRSLFPKNISKKKKKNPRKPVRARYYHHRTLKDNIYIYIFFFFSFLINQRWYRLTITKKTRPHQKSLQVLHHKLANTSTHWRWRMSHLPLSIYLYNKRINIIKWINVKDIIFFKLLIWSIVIVITLFLFESRLIKKILRIISHNN